MKKILSASIMVILWISCIVYLGLLSNWFRYGLSLEATIVAIPLVAGTVVNSILGILAINRNSSSLLAATFLGIMVTCFLVVFAQLQGFGEMPSFYLQDVRKGPSGIIKTPKGDMEYWIELENPFAYGHEEYLAIRYWSKEKRLRLPLQPEPIYGYSMTENVKDWGQLEETSNPNVYLLTIGPNLPFSGKSFKLNMATETVQPIHE